MGRPRGFIEGYTPTPERRELIGRVQDILSTSTVKPLTIRQIFYMLVSDHSIVRYDKAGMSLRGYDKTERAYKRLCEALNIARRARMIDMDDIRDDGLSRRCNAGWANKYHFLRYTKGHMRHFALDRQIDQPIKTYVWCEAGGMAPQLQTAVKEYHIPVLSSGGFDSVTTKHNFAQEISEYEQVVILHLGDLDPSGVHMYGSLDEDLVAFVDALAPYGQCELTLERIAVTPEQVHDMSLPQAPPKAKDNRAFEGLTTQCEAIPAGELQGIVQQAAEVYIDFDVLETTHADEKRISKELIDRYSDLFEKDV
ncbi:MAG: hypothetical protein V3T88_04440 [Nitrosomonadaceae bacterium]